MQSRPLLIISTRLPPQICGIGTFSWLLHRYWDGDTSQHRFLVVDDASRSDGGARPDGISEFGKDWSALGRALDQGGSADVLLHYAGRGYHRLGCPIRLPGILNKWKTKFSDARLIIFFHELPGPLPFTSRHYWLNACNRRIVRKLANLADLVITNSAEHVRTLEKLSRHRNVRCLPVASNVENTGGVEPERARTEFVIFGLPFGRWQTLRTFDSEIRAWQKNGILTKLHLVGPTDDKFDVRSGALLKSYPRPDVIVRHGSIPTEDISRLLSHAQFAFTTADESTWSKSTTLMAYFAHGCVVVARSKSADEPLSLAVRPEELASLSDVALRAKADASRRWYETTADWKILARVVSGLITSLPAP
jgi:hypothetical protein